MRALTIALIGGTAAALGGMTAGRGAHAPLAVEATLSEWTIKLSEPAVPAGQVTFTIKNGGSIPHAFEVEGRGIERETALIQPGGNATLTVDLAPGSYEIYCPVGGDSHKKLGMETHLKVVGNGRSLSSDDHEVPEDSDSEASARPDTATRAEPIRVTGGGPVIQILPGPFPFPDSATSIVKTFGAEQASLESQMQSGPYSNTVAPISGTFTFSAWDKGATRDSVDGVAAFTTRDGARWKVVLDRVQTKDVPHHPRFGGVIRGLYYHGATGVHTPLVPTINSAVALWSIAHLYRNGELVSDSAYVHVMLLSHTRRARDFALECWDCSRNRIDELQLQITPAPGQPKFDAPGGFLFVNWERSSSRPPAG